MKILHVIPSVSLSRGGPSYAIRGMTSSLAQRGLKVDLATTTADGKEAPEEGVRYFYFPRQFPKRWAFSPPLGRWLREHAPDYDLIHIHALFSYPVLAACEGARRSGIPYILRPLGTLSPWSLAQKKWRKRLYYRWFERKNLALAAAIHATTQLEAESLARLGFDRTTHVIPLGIDLPLLPSREGKTNSPVRLLFLSRLHPAKALPLLLESLALLRKEGLAPLLTVAGVGDRDYRFELERKIKTLGLTSQIEWAGFLKGEAKARAFREADIFVLPSYQESFGIAAAEAMAAGLPVIVSDQVGIAPEIQEEGAGVIVPCDAPSLKTGLEKLIRNPHLRFEMGERGKRLVQEKFALEKAANQLIELYEGIQNGRA